MRCLLVLLEGVYRVLSVGYISHIYIYFIIKMYMSIYICLISISSMYIWCLYELVDVWVQWDVWYGLVGCCI